MPKYAVPQYDVLLELSILTDALDRFDEFSYWQITNWRVMDF